ncbi:MAG: hypothetical protein AB1765_00905 [Candidatus Hydrogenedentota bacterium]
MTIYKVPQPKGAKLKRRLNKLTNQILDFLFYNQRIIFKYFIYSFIGITFLISSIMVLVNMDFKNIFKKLTETRFDQTVMYLDILQNDKLVYAVLFVLDQEGKCKILKMPADMVIENEITLSNASESKNYRLICDKINEWLKIKDLKYFSLNEQDLVKFIGILGPLKIKLNKDIKLKWKTLKDGVEIDATTFMLYLNNGGKIDERLVETIGKTIIDSDKKSFIQTFLKKNDYKQVSKYISNFKKENIQVSNFPVKKEKKLLLPAIDRLKDKLK